jgi:chromosome segregation ATPase
LKDQLGKAVENLESFRIRTQQVMNEQFEAATAEFARVSFSLAEKLSTSGAAHSAAAERLAFTAGEAASKLAQAADTMGAQMRAAGTSHHEATKRLTLSSEKVVTQVGRLVDRIDRIEVPGDLLTRQVNDARQRISDLATAIESSMTTDTTRQAAVQQATDSLERLLTRLSELSAFDAIEQSVGRLRSVVETTAGAIQGLGEQLATHQRGFAAMAADADRDRTAIARARASAEADLVQSTAALHKLQTTLADVADNLVVQLGDA